MKEIIVNGFSAWFSSRGDLSVLHIYRPDMTTMLCGLPVDPEGHPFNRRVQATWCPACQGLRHATSAHMRAKVTALFPKGDT